MNIISLENPSYEELCEQYKDIAAKRKEYEAAEKQLKVMIIDEAGEERMQYGVRVSVKERKGVIDMKLVQRAYGITDEELEGFRKESTTYWDVRGY